MIRATKVMWRRHPKLMAASTAIELAFGAGLWLTTGSAAAAFAAVICLMFAAAWLSLKIEDDRGTIHEYIDQIQGRDN